MVSVQALSQAWGLTRADIRYHLNELMEEGLLERVKENASPAKRGRPQQRYRLSTSHAPDNYPALCAALLSQAFQCLPESERDQFMETLARQIAGPVQLADKANQRFNQAVAVLDQHGYRARWEAHVSGPRISLRNCPYAAILAGHPELCDLDLRLIEQLTGTPMQHAARMNLTTGRPPACIFSTDLSR